MHLINGKIPHENTSGKLKVLIEGCDDLWSLYNLLIQGDYVSCSTHRKITRESEWGKKDTTVKRVYIKIIVHKTNFFVDAAELRISGVVAEQNMHVQTGCSHTITVEKGTTLVIEKVVWDMYSKIKLVNALKLRNQDNLLVLLLDVGIANLFVVSDVIVRHLWHEKNHTPQNKCALKLQKGSNDPFFYKVFLNIKKENISYEACSFILGGPGFVKNQFCQWVNALSDIKEDTKIKKLISQALICTTTTPYKHSLKEILTNKSIFKNPILTTAEQHISALKQFQRMLQTSPNQATYGPQYVEYVLKERAVATLLISDELFRSADIQKRRYYTDMVDSAREQKVEVLIFSNYHLCAKELQALGGIAAVLRYPLVELEFLTFPPCENPEK